jgi:hypothetical protein
LRHELIPTMQATDADFANRVLALGAAAQALQVTTQAWVAQCLPTVELPRAGEKVVLDSDACRRFSQGTVIDMLRFLWTREGWPQGDLTRDHWHRAAAIVTAQANTTDFPGRIRLERRPKTVLLFRQ